MWSARVTAFCLLLGVAGSSGSAAALTLQSDARMVSVLSLQCFLPPPPNPPQCQPIPGSQNPPSSFAPFNGSVSADAGTTATQNSQVGTSSMTGSGTAVLGGTAFSTNSVSRFSIGFLADAAASYSFTGQLSGSSSSGAGTTTTTAQLIDVTAGNTTVFQTGAAGQFSSTGALVAGHQYTVFVSASVTENANNSYPSTGSYSFTFAATPTAVPAPLFPYEPPPER